MVKKEEKVKILEEETQRRDFWQKKEEAVETTQKLNELKEETKAFNNLKKELEDLIKLKDLGEKEEELEKEIDKFERKIKKEEFRIFLSGKYDKGNAIISIYSGAGGQDAQDWAAMLQRMYERYAGQKGFKIKVIHQSFGEGGGPDGRIGIKTAILEVKGYYAFGVLKKENGVHRLVRISPFSAKQLRHTSFVLVEVLPEISRADESDIGLKPDDLRIDTFRASGPGGQYVNKRESAVRITHLPTGITVSCQSERLQGLNRQKAMKVLLSKLFQLKEEETKEKLKEIKGEKISASWGNQIRSYVLHPYRMVKDLRGGIETSDVDGVLDGNLDQFIENDKVPKYH